MMTLVFFGATGHLFTRKIFPALASFPSGDLENLSILAIGRRFTTQSEYINFLSTLHPNAGAILKQIEYLQADAREEDFLSKLTPHLNTQEVLFYLATLPSVYPDILKQIHRWRVNTPTGSIRIALEKPFGQDATSFVELEKNLQNTFPEEEIFYVDHYLGKSTVLSLIVLKAENLFMEKLLSREYLQEVRIAVCETEGVEEREAFYEETGAIRDIFQNHILQLLTLFAIDIPPLCEEDKRECQRFQQKVAEEKVRLLEMVRLPEAQKIFLGQYEGYRQEVNNSHSHTETLVSTTLFIDSPRWRNVPFRILTGKKMAEKRSFIEAVFHSVVPSPNRLSIEIQPEERIDLFINVKTPSMDFASTMAKLNFSYFGTFGAKSPEAYQKILYDFIHRDRTLFPNSRFIRQSWKITDELRQKIEQHKIIPTPYPPHTLRAEDFFILNQSERNPG
ncbi:MAG: hypothetical protein HPY68_02175 [Candidatus Atribacteria bacterium]|nr:hypothetical protein [Candidatus Atribacteria bacterium]